MSAPAKKRKKATRSLQASAFDTSRSESGALESFKVESRWSDEAMRRGFVPVAMAFLDRYATLSPHGLTASEAMFVVHVIRYKWNGEAPFPGYRSIALQMGVSVKSARRYAQSLERKKLLRRTLRLGDTNQFDFSPLMLALERAMQPRAPGSSRPSLPSRPGTGRAAT